MCFLELSVVLKCSLLCMCVCVQKWAVDSVDSTAVIVTCCVLLLIVCGDKKKKGSPMLTEKQQFSSSYCYSSLYLLAHIEKHNSREGKTSQ